MRTINLLFILITLCLLLSCKDEPLHCDIQNHKDFEIEFQGNIGFFFPNIMLPESEKINHLAFAVDIVKDNNLSPLDLASNSLDYTIYDQNDAIIHHGSNALKVDGHENIFILWDGTIAGIPQFGNFSYDFSITWEGDIFISARKVSILSMPCEDFQMLIDLDLDCDLTELQWMRTYADRSLLYTDFSPCD